MFWLVLEIPVWTEVFFFAFELDNTTEGKRKWSMCANLLFCLCSSTAVAFHSPPVTIKKEPPSPGSDPSQSCSHKQIPNGEQCLYARYTCQQVQYSAYYGPYTNILNLRSQRIHSRSLVNQFQSILIHKAVHQREWPDKLLNTTWVTTKHPSPISPLWLTDLFY